MRTIAIVQARMSSTRLPGKVLMELEGKTVLGHVVERVSRSGQIDSVGIATTVSPADDPLVEHARSLGVAVFRGSEDDVLGRYQGAAGEFGADVVVRITSDDPLKDPAIVDKAVGLRREHNLALVHNCLPPSYPEGLDVEVFSREALERAAAEAADPFDREHVTPYMYAHPELFPQKRFGLASNLSALRWTLDTPDDLAFVRAVYAALYRATPCFDMHDVLKLLETSPEFVSLNTHVERSHHYRERS